VENTRGGGRSGREQWRIHCNTDVHRWGGGGVAAVGDGDGEKAGFV